MGGMERRTVPDNGDPVPIKQDVPVGPSHRRMIGLANTLESPCAFCYTIIVFIRSRRRPLSTAVTTGYGRRRR